jgi:acetyl-CoA acyltransferase
MLSKAFLRTSARGFASKSTPGLKNVVLIDGCRIPFQPYGTKDYVDMMAYDLSRLAVTGLMNKTAISPSEIDYLLWGTVSQEIRTSNIARDVALGSGLPNSVTGHTVTQACISANQAICNGVQQIQTGRADVVIAGGVETFSDAAIRFSRPIRKKLILSQKIKAPMGKLKSILKGLKLSHLAPETPAIANMLTGEVMGHSADRLADRFGISRADQDAFGARSHQLAAKAHADGIFDDEIVAVNGKTLEEGIRGDSTAESMGKLKPAFVKPHGTVTAATASYFTDGAACTLIMSEDKAKELGLTPKAYLREYAFPSCDPFEELLLGPAYATTAVLKAAGLKLGDMDVIEFHEAFAGQVLANLAALDSDKFYADSFTDGTQKVGAVPMEKFNVHGGSLSIGHPFGATGARLVTTVANRLIREDGKFGLIAACADGGIGHACIIERHPDAKK